MPTFARTVLTSFPFVAAFSRWASLIGHPPVRLMFGACAALMSRESAAQSYSFTTFAGQAQQSGSADGSGPAARFNRPSGVAVDASGNVYVADSLNHTLRKITPGGVVSTLAGTAGQFGYVDDTGAAARFAGLDAIALDSAGNLFVSEIPAIPIDDSGNRFVNGNLALRRVTPAGVVTTLARFDAGSGVAVGRDGAVYYADNAYDEHGQFRSQRIRQLSPDRTLATIADRGIGSLNPNARVSFAIDANGTLFITDDSAHAIQKLSAARVLSTVAGYPGLSGTSDGPAPDARFTSPSGLAIDSTGTIFLTDAGTVIRRIDPTGLVVTVAGQFDQRGTVDGVGGFARFNGLADIAVDSAGNLYVADSANHTIRKGVPTNAPSPPIVSTAANSLTQNLTLGGNAVFTVAASGFDLRYQWLKNGVALPGASAETLSFSGVTAADAATYSVMVSNPAGATTLVAGDLAVHATTITSFTVRHAQPGAGMLWSIASGNGLLVAVGDNGTILTSTDGRTWTRRNSGTTDWLVGVTFGAGQFVVVGDRGRILHSRDGTSWAGARASGTTQRLNNVLYATNKFVAVGEAGTIVTSDDAEVWTPRESGVTGWLRGLAYNPAPVARTFTNYFAFPSTPTFLGGSPAAFSVSGERGAVVTSHDGITWVASYGPPHDVEALVSVPTESNFVGIGQNGTAVELRRTGYVNSRIMPTGHYYVFGAKPHPTGAQVRLRGVAQGASALFATGENGTILAAPDVSGPWARVPSGTTANLVGGVFHGNTLYIVGADETILQSDPLYVSRLINISTRSQVGTGANILISGFVVEGPVPKQILVRAAGPALTAFGLSGTLAAPILTLYDADSRPIATNTRWSTAPEAVAIAAAAARVGAFPFATDRADSALLLTLQPGVYTAHIAGAGETTGLSLLEVYDADASSNEGSRAINISTRSHVGTADATLIAGFVINGAASRRVLIRALGPSLAGFGLTGVLAEPEIRLFDASGALQATARAWSQTSHAADIRHAATLAGAFDLPEDSKDAALVATLLPGAYTVQVSGLNNTTGTALVEVYDLP
jgi:sugar lactone lactonase YvrE